MKLCKTLVGSLAVIAAVVAEHIQVNPHLSFYSCFNFQPWISPTSVLLLEHLGERSQSPTIDFSSNVWTGYVKRVTFKYEKMYSFAGPFLKSI